jgi:hypothetical protein
LAIADEIEPHIPVVDKCQRSYGTFSRSDFPDGHFLR